MIYVYVEDSTNGLGLVKRAFKEYTPNLKLVIESFNGIINIDGHINNLSAKKDDKIYYIYDNMIDNKVVNNKIKVAKYLIKGKENIKLLPITSFEYNILAAKLIELFAHRKYIEYIQMIKLYGRTSMDSITAKTKNEALFVPIYNILRKRNEKELKDRAKKTGAVIKPSVVEARTTFEQLCKEIFNNAFCNDYNTIGEKLGSCWEKDCCSYKNNKYVCNIVKEHTKVKKTDKLGVLFQNTHFYTIVEYICNDVNIETKPYIINIDYSIVAKSIRNKVNEASSVLKCFSNLEQYCMEGYTLEKAKKKCQLENKFSIDEVEMAEKLLK